MVSFEELDEQIGWTHRRSGGDVALHLSRLSRGTPGLAAIASGLSQRSPPGRRWFSAGAMMVSTETRSVASHSPAMYDSRSQ